MEIRAKLSLAVNDFKSGLDTAKKELDSFGTSGSKFNSKFAKDIRSSFDNLGPNIKSSRRQITREFDAIGKDINSSVRKSLGKTWDPLQQGFSKAAAKIAVNTSVIGGMFRNITKSAADNAKAIDAFTERNTRNRIIGLQRAADFESRVAQANRRIDKQRMVDQYGAKPSTSGTTAGLPASRTPLADARKAQEAEYTKWWASELNRRLDYTKRTDSLAMAASVKASASAGVARAQAAVSSAKAELGAKTASAKESLSISIAAARAETSHAISSARTRASAYIAETKATLVDSLRSAKVNADWQIAQFKRVQDYRKTFKPAIQDAKAAEFAGQVQAFKEMDRGLAATRYALYDVGQRFIAFGTVVTGALASAVQSSAKFESAFTSVERTTGLVLGNSGGAAEKLRAQLLELSTTIPVSFEQIAQIATLGAQMGIAADSVDNFAETVSKFSAITGISAEQAAQSFGRLGQLLDVTASEFENLSSAITYTGVNSVATDQEILSMSESIAAAGKQAGFSADEVIGMSAALASLKVRPEEARGVLARLFREISSQVSQAGSGLDDFAQVLGTTSTDAASLWKQDPSGFFAKFLEGAQATGRLDQTLTALGITNTRELNVIQRLSQNTGLLTQTMADAEKQYLLGTYSSEAYGLVVDDLNSKFTIFQSTLQALSAGFGDAMAGGVGIVIEFLTAIANAIGKLPKEVKFLVGFLGVLAAAFTIAFGSLAMGIAGLLAMKLALNGLAGEGIKASISMRTLVALFVSMVPSAGRAAASLNFVSNAARNAALGFRSMSLAMKSALISTGIGAALVGISALFELMGQDAATAGNAAGSAMLEAGGGAEAFSKALQADQKAIADGADAIGTLTVSYSDLAKAKIEDEQQTLARGRAGEEMTKAFQAEADASGKLADDVSALKSATDAYNGTLSETESLTKSVTMGMGAQTAAFYIESLSKYKGPEGNKNTFLQDYLNPDNAQARQLAEAFGFKLSGLIAGSMTKDGGGSAYVESFKKDVRELDKQITDLGTDATAQERQTVIEAFGKDAKWTSEQIALVANKSSTLGGVDSALTTIYAAMEQAAGGADGLREAVAQNEAVLKMNSLAMQELGYSAAVADGLVGGLAEELKGYMDAAFSGEAANNSAADSFQTFANGISDVSDGLSGARQDTANWVSYMNAAREAAIANGEGFGGSVKRILAGIEALAKAGKDTKKPFADMKAYIQNAVSAEGYTELRDEITKAADPEQLKGIIDSWTQLQLQTKGATSEAYKYGVVLQSAFVADPALLKTLLASFSNVTSSAGKAKTAIEKMSEALDKMFEKFNRKMDLEAAFDSLGASMAKNKKNFSVFTDDGRANISALEDVISQLAISADGDQQKMANSLMSLKTAFAQMGITGGTAVNLINVALRSTGKTGKNVATAIKAAVTSIVGAFTGALTADTSNSVRLIGDYVSDLQSILSDAFDNRYGKQEGLDAIASAWEGIRDSAKSAEDAIKDANKTIAGLNVDKNLLEYQLKVAIKYKDVKRETAIRNKLTEVNGKLADESAKISESVAARDKTLDIKDNSKAAIDNRNQVRGLVKTYTDYLGTLAKSGMSSDDLKGEAKKLATEFLTQGQNLGFAKAELETYTSAFEGDFTKTIDGLPRDFTLTVNTDPALRAIETFVQKANEALSKVNVVGNTTTTTSGNTPTGSVATAEQIAAYNDAAKVVADPKATYADKASAAEDMRFFQQVYGGGARATVTATSTPVATVAKPKATTTTATKKADVVVEEPKSKTYPKPDDGELYIYKNFKRLKTNYENGSGWATPRDAYDNAVKKVKEFELKYGPGYKTGGLVTGPGSGTSDSIAARLSNGEFVVKANAVRAYGVDFMNSLNQMRVSRPMPASAAVSAAGGSSMVYLSPEDRQLLRAAIDRPVALYTENTKIAQSANAGNLLLAQRGSN